MENEPTGSILHLEIAGVSVDVLRDALFFRIKIGERSFKVYPKELTDTLCEIRSIVALDEALITIEEKTLMRQALVQYAKAHPESTKVDNALKIGNSWVSISIEGDTRDQEFYYVINLDGKYFKLARNIIYDPAYPARKRTVTAFIDGIVADGSHIADDANKEIIRLALIEYESRGSPNYTACIR